MTNRQNEIRMYTERIIRELRKSQQSMRLVSSGKEVKRCSFLLADTIKYVESIEVAVRIIEQEFKKWTEPKIDIAPVKKCDGHCLDPKLELKMVQL